MTYFFIILLILSILGLLSFSYRLYLGIKNKDREKIQSALFFIIYCLFTIILLLSIAPRPPKNTPVPIDNIISIGPEG